MPSLLVKNIYRTAAAALMTLSLGASCGMAVYQPSDFVRARSVPYAEKAFAQALIDVGAGDIGTALSKLESLLNKTPNFRLAQLVKGDLLLARTRPIEAMGNAGSGTPEQLSALRQEALARLTRYHLQSPGERVPRYLLQMPTEYRHAIIVDSSASTMYVFENHKGAPRYVADYYVTVGKNGLDKRKEGDKRTPIGVYFANGALPKQRLTDFYGRGAYPINYPNEWDRREGRSGHGIWVHGVPRDTYSRPPRASDGCVVLTNEDLEALSRLLDLGETPVIITDHVDWVTLPKLGELRASMYEHIESWRRDWESRNVNAYLRHYSPRFETGKVGFDEFAAQKRRVNGDKEWIRVRLGEVSVFLYPGRDDLAVVNFKQYYSSNNLANEMKKRQYWLREDNRWRIVYEGSA